MHFIFGCDHCRVMNHASVPLVSVWSSLYQVLGLQQFSAVVVDVLVCFGGCYLVIDLRLGMLSISGFRSA